MFALYLNKRLLFRHQLPDTSQVALWTEMESYKRVRVLEPSTPQAASTNPPSPYTPGSPATSVYRSNKEATSSPPPPPPPPSYSSDTMSTMLSLEQATWAWIEAGPRKHHMAVGKRFVKGIMAGFCKFACEDGSQYLLRPICY